MLPRLLQHAVIKPFLGSSEICALFAQLPYSLSTFGNISWLYSIRPGLIYRMLEWQSIHSYSVWGLLHKTTFEDQRHLIRCSQHPLDY